MDSSDIEKLAQLFDSVPVEVKDGVRFLQAGEEWSEYSAHREKLIAQVKARLVHATAFQSFKLDQVSIAAGAIVDNLLAFYSAKEKRSRRP